MATCDTHASLSRADHPSISIPRQSEEAVGTGQHIMLTPGFLTDRGWPRQEGHRHLRARPTTPGLAPLAAAVSPTPSPSSLHYTILINSIQPHPRTREEIQRPPRPDHRLAPHPPSPQTQQPQPHIPDSKAPALAHPHRRPRRHPRRPRLPGRDRRQACAHARGRQQDPEVCAR